MTAAGFAACIAIAAFALPQKTEAAVAGDGKVYLENIDVTGMSQEEIQAVIDAKMEKYRQDKKYEEAMQKIHTERAAEITAKIIEAYLKGDL